MVVLEPQMPRNRLAQTHHLCVNWNQQSLLLGRSPLIWKYERWKGGVGPPDLENFRKKGCFIIFEWEKTNFTLWAPS